MAGNNSFLTSLLGLLDDDKFMKDVMSKPCSGMEQVNVRFYLNLVEKILNQAMAIVDNVAKNSPPKGDQCQSKSSTSLSLETSIPLSSTINELCYQITCKARTSNVYQTVSSLSNMLSSFSWDAKAVLTLLALSVYYAEHWRLTQIEESDDLLSLTAKLRGSHAIGKSSDTQRIKAFVALNNLIKLTLEFTKCAVEFVSYSKDFGEISASIDISARFYYIIVIILGCSVQFSGLISMSNEFPGQNLWTFSDQVTKKYESFKKEVEYFREKHAEQISYEKIKKLSKHCTDIVELMAALFCTKNDFLTVYHCSKGTTVTVEKFRNKIVMLLISDLDLSDEDLKTIKSIYSESNIQRSYYKIMWVPIVEEHNEVTQKKFLEKRSGMRWYTSNSMVSKPAAKFIRKKWQFRQRTKVVVLNQQGKVVNMDAMAMIRLWGQEAFPFMESKGKELWIKQGINWFKLVVNMVFPDVEKSIEGEELIFLYGSDEDPQTVQKIEKYLSEINGYIGSYKVINISTKREQFLTRLESCLSLKMQASSDVYDSLAQELLQLYTSYKQFGGFAVIARGSRVVVNTRLMDFETVLSQHQMWVKAPQPFEAAFKRHYDEVIKKPRRHHFYIPSIAGNMPENIKCAKCSRYMKTAVSFECCHGDEPMMPSRLTSLPGTQGFQDSAVAAPQPATYPSAVAAPPEPATNQSAVPASESATSQSAIAAPPEPILEFGSYADGSIV